MGVAPYKRVMRRARIGVLSLLFASVCACEPTPVAVPPQPRPVEVATPVATATSVAGPGYDLSPVSEPPDIVGIGRWRSPMTTVGNLASCAGVPAVIVEVNAHMGVDWLLRAVLRSSLDTRKIAALVSLDAPVDVLVTLDPQVRLRPPMIAVAMGLSSLDGAKVAIAPEGEAKVLAPGIWRVKGDRGIACAVAASVGSTPARLVCADSEKTLSALAPYLARTAPTLELGGPDVHVEARVDVFRKRYGDAMLKNLGAMPGAIRAEYGVGNARFDALLFDAAIAGKDDAAKVLADVDRVTAEVRSEKSGACLRATADLDLNGTSSWLAGTLADRLDRAAPPPAIYWRLPKESQLALYSRGMDPARFTGVVQKSRELLEAALAAESVGSAAERKKITELIDLPYGKDTTSVLAHGSIDLALPEQTGKGAPQKTVDATSKRLAGWTLLGIGEGSAAVKKQLKAWVEAYKQPGTQTFLKKEARGDAKSVPVVKSGTAPASLGASAEALEITIPNIEAPPPAAGPKPAKPDIMSLTFHVLLMPDSDTTWLALGGSKDELVKRLLAVKTGADEKGQLASRAGLDTLKSGKQMFGGFVSAAVVADKTVALVQGLDAVEPGTFSQDDVGFAQALTALPNQGRTPMFVTFSGTPGAKPKLNVAVELQQGAFQDMKTLVISSFSYLSRMGIFP
jgi:hypothetical protein